MSDTVKLVAGGLVGVAFIVAIGSRASGLAKVGRVGFQGTGGLFRTVERG